MNRKALVLTAALSCSLLFSIPSLADLTITNNTNYYLHSNDGSETTLVAPGQTAAVDQWKALIACATKEPLQFDGKYWSCQEWGKDKDTNTTISRQGGYATWFMPATCANSGIISIVSTYSCHYDTETHALTFNYKPVTQKDTSGNIVAIPKPQTYNKIPFRGVNISGLEYDGTYLDAIFQLPDLPEARYFVEQGMNTIRLPIRWEFVVSDKENSVESHSANNTKVNQIYMDAIKDVVKKYLDNGLNVVLDLHNYMRFCPTGAEVGQLNEPSDPILDPANPKKPECTIVTADQLQTIWSILANQFHDLALQYPNQLVFGLMNEPYTIDAGHKESNPEQVISTEGILDREAAAVKAIRNAGLKNNLILLSGNGWDPLHHFFEDQSYTYRTPNAKVFTKTKLARKGIRDSSHIAMEVHQYFNDNEKIRFSGTTRDCKAFQGSDEERYTQFKQWLGLEGDKSFVKDWMQPNGMKVFLGEFGGSTNSACVDDINMMLRYVHEHAYDANKPDQGGFIGWTAWRANRHVGDTQEEINNIWANFNFLQQLDNTVYGDGRGGIKNGTANALMQNVFSYFLIPVQ